MRWLVAIASVLLVTDLAAAAPGEPRLLKGTLEWPATLTAEPMAVVRGEDGRLYYVDASTAERLNVPMSGQVSVVGIEGMKPQEISAVIIGGGDSALTALQTPRITGAESASPVTETTGDLWRVHGKVQAVTVSDIVVQTVTGQSVRVDASKLSAWTRQSLRPGDEVKLFGTPQEDRRLVATGFIQTMSEPSSR